MSKKLSVWCCAVAAMIGCGMLGEWAMAGETAKVTQSRAKFSPEQHIAQTLRQKLKVPLEFVETPLSDVVEFLREEYNISIVFDKAALEGVAISTDTEVSVHLRDVSLRSALVLMMREPGLEDLTFLIDQEVLLITTKERANESLVTRVYPVDDLINLPSRSFNGREDDGNFDSVISMVISCVAHNSWQENGTGTGEIHPLAPGLLVISQTRGVHDKIAALFADIRSTRSKILASAQTSPTPEKPVTRGFSIQVDWGKDTKHAQEVLAKAIKESVDWDQSDAADEKTWLHFLPNRILVRHQAKVVRQVETLLVDMKLAYPTQYGFGGGGGSVGGGGGGFFQIPSALAE